MFSIEWHPNIFLGETSFINIYSEKKLECHSMEKVSKLKQTWGTSIFFFNTQFNFVFLHFSNKNMRHYLSSAIFDICTFEGHSNFLLGWDFYPNALFSEKNWSVTQRCNYCKREKFLTLHFFSTHNSILCFQKYTHFSPWNENTVFEACFFICSPSSDTPIFSPNKC